MTKSDRLLASKGYTLIEILVVLFIISITASIALLSLNRNQNKQVEIFTNELTQLITLAEEQAILQPAILGLHFSGHDFHFASYQPSITSKERAWLPLSNELLNKRVIPNNIEIKLEVNHMRADFNKNTPQIVISTNGDMTPFTIFIGTHGQKPRYAITGTADGSVSNQSLIPA